MEGTVPSATCSNQALGPFLLGASVSSAAEVDNPCELAQRLPHWLRCMGDLGRSPSQASSWGRRMGTRRQPCTPGRGLPHTDMLIFLRWVQPNVFSLRKPRKCK